MFLLIGSHAPSFRGQLFTFVMGEPRSLHINDHDVWLLSFESFKSLWFRYCNVEAQRHGSITNFAMLSYLIFSSGYVNVYPNGISELSTGTVTFSHQPRPPSSMRPSSESNLSMELET
ncbi:hypothetical protein N665_0213s0003 [Sinapis alba]|nr:hypothetical protein N665_0213s0003 [Sinapis alba]